MTSVNGIDRSYIWQKTLSAELAVSARRSSDSALTFELPSLRWTHD
jgi:hypothetical protein